MAGSGGGEESESLSLSLSLSALLVVDLGNFRFLGAEESAPLPLFFLRDEAV
jgi:hypothetical protein